MKFNIVLIFMLLGFMIDTVIIVSDKKSPKSINNVQGSPSRVEKVHGQKDPSENQRKSTGIVKILYFSRDKILTILLF